MFIKKLLASLIFLVALAVSTASATSITITGIVVQNWQAGGSTAQLRIYAQEPGFTASDGTIILGGQVGSQRIYQTYTCTIVSTTITCPSVTLQSTSDALSNQSGAKYWFAFYQGTTRKQFLYNTAVIVPASPTSTTWSAITAAQPSSGNNGGGGGGGNNLDNLSDVVITSLQSGHFLRYNGTNFVNAFLSAGDIPSLDASKTTSGTFNSARLGSGTANSSKYLRGDSSWADLNSSAVGLGNVNNTTDAAKPLSDAAIAALAAKNGAIQYQFGGSNVGAAGDKITVNFAGAGVTVSQPNPSSITYTISGSGGGGGGTINVTGGNMVAASGFPGTFADGITAIGSTATTVLLDEDVTLSSALVIPANIVILPTNKAKFIESGTATITFQGIGLFDTMQPQAVFEGFEAGDVTWSASTVGHYPSDISTELWDTGNNSETDRADRADKAIAADAPVWIRIHPRVMTSSVFYRDRHSVMNTGDAAGGIHDNTFVEPEFTDNMPHTMGSNSEFTCTSKAVRIRQSSVDYSNRIVQTKSLATNVKIHGCTFEGQGGEFDGAATAVSVVNATESGITDNRFVNVSAYNAFIINNAFVEEPNKFNYITFNTFEGYATQLLGSTDGQFVNITDNTVILNGYNTPVACALIDIEPNDLYTKLSNINISRNVFDLRNLSNNVAINAIQVQSAHSDGVEGLRVNDNEILAGEHNGGTQHDKARSAIIIDGADNFEVIGNKIQGVAYYGIQVNQSRRGLILDNRLSNGGKRILLAGTQETTVAGNTAWATSSGLTETAVIEEAPFYHPITTSGTTGNIVYEIYNSNYGRIQKHYRSLNVRINGMRRTISAVNVAEPNSSVTFSTSAGTLTAQTITSADIDSAAETIAETNHGWNTGAVVHYLTSGTVLAGLTNGGMYYVIRVDANYYKLASSYANAMAGTAINLTNSPGSGTHTIYPVMELVGGENVYGTNFGFDTYTVSEYSSSDVLDANSDGIFEDAAETSGVVNAVEIYADAAFGGYYSGNGTVKGSNVACGDGGATTLGTFGSTPYGSWTRLILDNKTFYKCVWVTIDNGGNANAAEIRFMHGRRQLNYSAQYATAEAGGARGNAFDGDLATTWTAGAGANIGIQLRTKNDNTSSQTSTTYTFNKNDIGNEVRACNGSASTYRLNTTTAMGLTNPRDFDTEVLNVCVGAITFDIVSLSGVTLRNNTGTLAQWKRARIVATSATEFVISYSN